MIYLAIKAIKDLVTKFQSIQAQIAGKQAELERLRKKHLDFWGNFQEECSGTGHSLTEKEKDALAKYNKLYTIPYGLRPKRKNGTTITQFDMHISYLGMHGYRCAYCLRRVQGQVDVLWEPRLDLCKRESFDKWLGFQEDKWPPEKMGMLDKARVEVESFFEKAEPLEQAIDALKKEAEEIRAILEPVWELLDKALGKDVQRQKEMNKVRCAYEEKLRATAQLIPRKHDRDAYYYD